jgi:hypothetical protein
MTTVAPAFNIASAIAYPKPRVEPVMTATLFLIDFVVTNLYLRLLASENPVDQ